MSQVILVDKNDTQVGVEDKLKAHELGKLHRAFSIFIFNKQGQTMLQQRALGKYHSGGLWTNTTCSHPEPGETLEAAVHRRLNEEMGFDCEMREVFSFVYKAKLDKGLTEHEFDHVFVGHFEDVPKPNPEEAMNWKWMAKDKVLEDMAAQPSIYTYWFREAFPKVLKHLK